MDKGDKIQVEDGGFSFWRAGRNKQEEQYGVARIPLNELVSWYDLTPQQVKDLQEKDECIK